MNEFTCQYCGHHWERKSMPKEVVCPKCNDTNIKLVIRSKKIDYYAGSPPFEKEDPDKWNL